MLRTFLNLLHSPLGFHSASVMTAKVPVNMKRHPHLEQQWPILQHVFDRVRAVPEYSPLARRGRCRCRRISRLVAWDGPTT